MGDMRWAVLHSNHKITSSFGVSLWSWPTSPRCLLSQTKLRQISASLQKCNGIFSSHSFTLTNDTSHWLQDGVSEWWGSVKATRKHKINVFLWWSGADIVKIYCIKLKTCDSWPFRAGTVTEGSSVTEEDEVSGTGHTVFGECLRPGLCNFIKKRAQNLLFQIIFFLLFLYVLSVFLKVLQYCHGQIWTFL